MQFKAGYIIECVAKLIANNKEDFENQKFDKQVGVHRITGLLRHISSFEVDFYYMHNVDFKNLNPVLATLNNIITRGLPTLAPILIEQKFEEIGLVKNESNEFEYKFPKSIKEIDFQTIFELLHIIEPQLTITKERYAAYLGSNLEWDFLRKFPFLTQILESQRDFKRINKKLSGGKTVDFSFTYPYLYWNEEKKSFKNKGRIYEIDGPHHLFDEYKYYDSFRDNMSKEEGFDTLRYSNFDIQNQTYDDKTLIGQDIYEVFETNFKRDINSFFAEYTLIFVPVVVARIQKVLMEFFLANFKAFESFEKIKIGIIERDLPGGALAIKIFQEMIFNINAILEEKDRLIIPEIELTIFENKKYVFDSKLHLEYKVEDEEFFKENEFDLIIDNSVLRRKNTYKEIDFLGKRNTIKIRSSHYYSDSFGENRRVYCAKLLNYRTLVKKRNDGSYIPVTKLEPNINYFIQNIFRKKTYREGQLPIISRALQQKPVIGLLPTGGGKSLTYQLPTFLQPGLSLIVDPIKSLMEDQVRVLKSNWIDTCEFINSNLQREQKEQRLIDFLYGENQLFFISPERFVMEDFRSIIQNIDDNSFGLAFSYCIIDEVHCVSEWGHDFRSTYLMLGKNAQTFVKTRSKKPAILMGLTATASFDVLADIERELQIQSNDVANAIIMIENTIRPELFFRVIDVTDSDRMGILNQDFINIPNNLNKINQKDLLMRSLQHHSEEFEPYELITQDGQNVENFNTSSFLLKEDILEKTAQDICGIIFCPVRGEKTNAKGEFINPNGVNSVHKKLKSKSKGLFYSTEDDNLNKEVQQHFKDFTDEKEKVKHIVCTKAFGMGIDKSNIRTTYHYIYSSSLESLVQEVGRSGRDKKISEANILIGKDKVYKLSIDAFGVFQNEKFETLIKEPFHRKQLRKWINSKDSAFNSLRNLENELTITVNNFNKWNAEKRKYESISDNEKEDILKILKKNIISYYEDRSIHDFFFDSNFRGVDTERSQFYALVNSREFTITSKLKELEEKYNEDNETSYKFGYWTNEDKKRLYISNNDGEEYGYISLEPKLNLNGNFKVLNEINIFLFSFDSLERLIESEVIDDTLNDKKTLKEKFDETQDGFFSFYIASEKKYLNTSEEIFNIFKLMGNHEAKIRENEQNIFKKVSSASKISDCIIKSYQANDYYFFDWFSLNKNYDKKYISELEEIYLQHKTDAAKLFVKKLYQIQIEKSLRQANSNFWNFLLLLEENIPHLRFSYEKNNLYERRLRFYFNRNRYYKPTNDTGRLIYRMYSMGFLTDYKIDYNKNNLYKCTFRKYEKIEDYVRHIETYLRRYLSEVTALDKITVLREKLTKETLIENILECLYFLSEFSYEEIANKRKAATDEIEKILINSISDEKYTSDWFEQNKFIKEQIFFYFNAKYARPFFEIDGKNYSLLVDYTSNRKKQPDCYSEEEILIKYLDVLKGKHGTEQNNYKHMIGSCKKIMRSLSKSDLENEWILRLLKAFALYSVNNVSYIKEANDELDMGFNNLYRDKEYSQEGFIKIESIFNTYFDKLLENIKKENNTIRIIEMLRLDLLFKMQTIGINNLIRTEI